MVLDKTYAGKKPKQNPQTEQRRKEEREKRKKLANFWGKNEAVGERQNKRAL